MNDTGSMTSSRRTSSGGLAGTVHDLHAAAGDPPEPKLARKEVSG